MCLIDALYLHSFKQHLSTWVEVDKFDKIFYILKLCAHYNALCKVKISTIISIIII